METDTRNDEAYDVLDDGVFSDVLPVLQSLLRRGQGRIHLSFRMMLFDIDSMAVVGMLNVAHC